jgi:hypothetical protein
LVTMTTLSDIVNRALMIPGTRTTVTAAELANNTSNEAIQANQILVPVRKQLLRMAPWNSALKTANLVYITSVNGTPENTSPAPQLWTPGLPAPPWAYEYQFPVDCLRACWIIPGTQTGYAGGVPVTTAVTGGAPSFWAGPPIKFRVQNDQFYPVTAASVASGGTGYAVGDIITLVSGPNTSMPIGAPAQLQVLTLSGSAVATVAVISVLPTETSPLGGSYFAIQSNPVAQGSTTGSGTGATFNLTQGAQASQRVILCNQEFATLSYIQDLPDPNQMDDLFQEAYVKILGALLCQPLTGDKRLADMAIREANQLIMQARTADGNEGLMINDTTPDWLRIRGVDFPQSNSGPEIAYDWGNLWSFLG